jgi:hypothetical protein
MSHAGDMAMTSKMEMPRSIRQLPVEEVELSDEPSSPIHWDSDEDRIKVLNPAPTNMSLLLDGKWGCEKDDADFKPDIEIAASACSPSALEKIEGDIEKADNKCLRRLVVPRNRLVPLVREMSKIYPKCSIQMSGFFLYPADGGYMGWHTNSDAPCTRVYITHVAEGGKSFFRYRLNGEYVTSWDKAGWNLRQFEVSPDGWEGRKENALWHCVYAEEPRMSIGFRINRNLL